MVLNCDRHLALGALPAPLRGGRIRRHGTLLGAPSRRGSPSGSSSSSRWPGWPGAPRPTRPGRRSRRSTSSCRLSLAALGLILFSRWSALTHTSTWARADLERARISFPIAMIGYTGLEKVSNMADLREGPEQVGARQRALVGVHRRHRVRRRRDGRGVGVPARRAPVEHRRRYDRLAHLGERPHARARQPRSAPAAPTGCRWPAVRGRPTACAILLMAISTSFSGCGRLAEAMARRDSSPGALRAHQPPADGTRRRRSPASGLWRSGSSSSAPLYPRPGGADAGVALQLRHPDRVHDDAGVVVWLRIVAPGCRGRS